MADGEKPMVSCMDYTKEDIIYDPKNPGVFKVKERKFMVSDFETVEMYNAFKYLVFHPELHKTNPYVHEKTLTELMALPSDELISEVDQIATNHAIHESQKDGFVSFKGNESCRRQCRGWDGISRRCDCGNRRVHWATENSFSDSALDYDYLDGFYVFPKAS
jgi:hypothetical protein